MSRSGVVGLALLLVVTTLIVAPAHTAAISGLTQSDNPVAGRVAALGDSYSSGEGNPPFDPGTAGLLDTCHRSPQAWPRLLGVDSQLHLACSGATTDALFQGQMPVAPDNVGQVQRLQQLGAAAPIDVVTVTIGGNNIGFADILAQCYTQALGACLTDLPSNQRAVDAATATIQQDVLPAIHAAAPSARVFLVGYPRLLSGSYDSVVKSCRRWLSRTEHAHALQLQRYVNTKERSAARAAGVSFVDVTNALDHHELCARHPWVRHLTIRCGIALLPDGAGLDPASSYCGHPTERGQRALADRVRRGIGPRTAR
jgi:lysophospholipase L1-like esterase